MRRVLLSAQAVRQSTAHAGLAFFWKKIMARSYKDFTGRSIGNITVLGRDRERKDASHAYWLIRLECCGTIKSVASKILYDNGAKPVSRCIDCYRANLAANKPHIDGVMIPGRGIGAGWWPVIVGPMGPRWAISAWHGQSSDY